MPLPVEFVNFKFPISSMLSRNFHAGSQDIRDLFFVGASFLGSLQCMKINLYLHARYCTFYNQLTFLIG